MRNLVCLLLAVLAAAPRLAAQDGIDAKSVS